MASRAKTFLWILPLVLGVVGGALSGWLVAEMVLSPNLNQLDERLRDLLRVATTSTTPTVQVVPVTPRPLSPLSSDALVSRRSSPVVSIVKKPASNEGIDVDRSLAQAVALTSDGWLATPSVALNGLHISDVSVLWNGRIYPVSKAVRDTATGITYLRIDARDLPPVALVRAGDVTPGSGVWVEPKPKRIFLQMVSDVRLQSGAGTLSSEQATRRFLVSGELYAGATGGAVWDEGGQLMGLLESHTADGWRVIPASDMSMALSAVLAGRPITHAYAGIRTVDLSELAFGTSSTLPLAGALVRGDRRTPAVATTSPLAGRLQEGDVIERVERDTLDGNADLGEGLLDYLPGTAITFYGRRNDRAMQWSFALGSVTTSETVK